MGWGPVPQLQIQGLLVWPIPQTTLSCNSLCWTLLQQNLSGQSSQTIPVLSPLRAFYSPLQSEKNLSVSTHLHLLGRLIILETRSDFPCFSLLLFSQVFLHTYKQSQSLLLWRLLRAPEFICVFASCATWWPQFLDMKETVNIWWKNNKVCRDVLAVTTTLLQITWVEITYGLFSYRGPLCPNDIIAIKI